MPSSDIILTYFNHFANKKNQGQEGKVEKWNEKLAQISHWALLGNFDE